MKRSNHTVPNAHQRRESSGFVAVQILTSVPSLGRIYSIPSHALSPPTPQRLYCHVAPPDD